MAARHTEDATTNETHVVEEPTRGTDGGRRRG